MIYIKLFLIANLVVFIADNTDFVDSVKYIIWRKWIKQGDYRNLTLKPFDCSLCMTFWTCLIYLMAAQQFSLYTVAFTALVAFITPQIKDLQTFLQDCIQTLINMLYTYITPK